MASRDLTKILFDVGGELVATGSSNAYAVQSAQGVNGYYAGLWLRIKANHTNNGASTLSVNGLATAPIRKGVNTALAGGEIVSGQYFEVLYDETNSVFQLQMPTDLANAQLANMAQATIKGRAAGAGSGAPQDLTGAQALAVLPTSVATAAIVCPIDNGAAVITTGIKADQMVPFDCTITEWTLLANTSGSIVIDVWKDTYGNYPPTVADSITASAKPTISSATKGQSSTLTGWTTTITAGQTLRFNVDSITSINRATLILKVTKT